MKFLLIGHRGAMGYAPENTLKSFEIAIKDGVDAVECDVHLTKDEVPVVIHDEKLDRTTNATGFIKDLMYNQLKNFDAGSWFHKDFAGERIPLLEDVVKLVKKSKIIIVIELKVSRIKYRNIEERVSEIIKKYDIFDRTIVISEVIDTLENIKKVNQKIKTGILIRSHPDLKNFNCDYYLPRYNLVNEELIRKIHFKNKKLYTWTVNDLLDFEKLYDMGVDGIATNYPKMMKKIL